MFQVVGIPVFRDNYIWLLRKGAQAVVVDPGDANPVLRLLDQQGLSLAAILITHYHMDHQGGVVELLSHFPAEVFAPDVESIAGVTRPLGGGETINLVVLGSELQVIAVPGHTLGHLAYYGSGCLFPGDTLFGAGCGRLFEGSAAQMHASLMRLAALPDETAVYCAHEYTEANLRFAVMVEPQNPALKQRLDDVLMLRATGQWTIPSTIGVEKRTNPFLRCDEPSVIAAARRRAPTMASDPVSVFATLREWKNCS